MAFLWSLSDNKSPQVSRTLFSILIDLNNDVVFICPLISKSSSAFINPFGVVPIAPITIGITVSFMFHWFFSSLARSRYLFLFSLYFNFTLKSAGTTKSPIREVLFLLTITSLVEIRWCVCIPKSQRSLCVSFTKTDSRLCIYYLIVW